MRWNPFRRTSQPECEDPNPSLAVERAKQHLDELHKKAPEVEAVSNRLQRLREDNHFAEMIRASMRGA